MKRKDFPFLVRQSFECCVFSKNQQALATGLILNENLLLLNTPFIENKSLLSTIKEPIGAKAPTFAQQPKSVTFEQHLGASFALLCQAQAFPTPLQRLVLNKFTHMFVLVNGHQTNLKNYHHYEPTIE